MVYLIVSPQEIIQFLLRPLAGVAILIYVFLWILGQKSTDIIRSFTSMNDLIELDTYNLNITSFFPRTGRQEPQLFADCKLPLRNSTYFSFNIDRVEVRYELLGYRGRIDTREGSRFIIRDLEPHDECELQFNCPVPWHIIRDAGGTNEPYLEGSIEINLTPCLAVPLITYLTGWHLSLSILCLEGDFSTQIPKDEWYLSTDTSYDKIISKADWEEVSDG